MTGGRVLGDIRDLPFDKKNKTKTIPIRYGIHFSSVFLLVNEALAYGFGLLLYWTANFRFGYLACMGATIIGGTVINMFFVLNPTPKNADRANRLSLGLLGMLYTVGMVLGRNG